MLHRWLFKFIAMICKSSYFYRSHPMEYIVLWASPLLQSGTIKQQQLSRIL